MIDRTRHRRTHHLLLLSRLLSVRDAASPFTLVLDSLEQSGQMLVREYIHQAKSAKATVVLLSFETYKRPSGVDFLIKGRRKDAATLQKEITQAVTGSQTCLLIIDTLHPLARLPDINLPAFLSSLIAPTTSIVATYHLDIPLSSPASPYNPSPLNLLKYLATTIFSTHSLSQVLARRRAAERSVAEPVFGLAEEVEGVLIGLGSNDARGIVLEMEHRRKSGREVEEWFFIPAPPPPAAIDRPRERAILLEDHPLFRVSESTEGGTIDGAEAVSTFSLGLTEKQKLDRDGVVLPYFDAQKEGGGVGGRILYDMGVEDDFDEEEDEI